MDYMTLKGIWWLFVAVLVAGFMLLGGRDLGVAFLLPWVGKTDEQRRLLLNSIGPTWEGNQVWFITTGGALFAAWPFVYAVAFSSFYYALLLVLFALILRPPGFDYRSKLANPFWRTGWDIAVFLSGFVPSLLFGVALGNVFLGIPFHFDDTLRAFYTGQFLNLLHPFALLVGLVSLGLCVTQGALFLNVKIADVLIQERARRYAQGVGGLTILSFLGCGLWLRYLPGYHIVKQGNPQAMLIPTHKTVVLKEGAWLDAMTTHPSLWGLVGLTCLIMLFTLLFCQRCPKKALYGYSVAMVGAIGVAASGLFPFILPSSSHPNHSLTAWDATSSAMTLHIMFWVVVLFLPIVLLYTGYAFRMMRGPLDRRNLSGSEAY